MSRPRVSAAAVLGILALSVLLVVFFWPYIMAAFGLGLSYHLLRMKHGPRRARRGRTLLELGAAGVAAWWVGKQSRGVVEQAIRSGAEISVKVPARKAIPQGSYTATRYRRYRP